MAKVLYNEQIRAGNIDLRNRSSERRQTSPPIGHDTSKGVIERSETLVEKENWRKNKDDAAKKSKSAAETIQTSFGSGRTFAALSAEKVTGVMSTGGSSVPGDAVAVMITGLGPRCVHKPEVVNKLTSEKAMAELDLGLDRLMKEEGLDKAGPRELSEKLVEENKLYSGDKLVEKFHKTNPQPGQAKETKPSELQTGIRREEAAEELVPQI